MNCKLELLSVLALIAAACCPSSLQAQSDDDFRTVTLTNSGDAPGTNPPLPIGSVGIPVINDLGQVAFFAELNGPSIGGTGGRGDALFSEATPTGFSQVFREDEFVPNSNDSQTLERFPNVANFSNSGQTIQNVGGRISNGIPPRLVLRASSSSDREVLVDISGNISGLSGVSLASTPSGTDFRLNDIGEVSFSAEGNLFTETGGQGFRIAASTFDILRASQVAGLSEDVLLATVDSLALNDSSQNLFSSTFSSLESGLLLEENGTFSLVASTGTDIEPGLELDRFFDATLNNRGDTVFTAGLAGAGTTTSSDSAIVGNASGGLEVLAREGDTVPGTNFTFSAFSPDTTLVLGGGGDAAFLSRFVGGPGEFFGTDDGIFAVNENGDIELLAYEGGSLAGLGDGVVVSNLLAPAINENGQVAFQAVLTGDDVTFDNDTAIFAQDLNGVLQLIAREGDLLNVSDDPAAPNFLTIDDLNFFGGSGDGDGTSSGFNNLGEVAFRAEFGRNSGVFVSSRVASVPEPSSLLAGLLGASLCLTRRNRYA